MAFDPATAVQAAAVASLDVAAVTDLGATVYAHPPELGPGDDPLATTAWILIDDIGLVPEGGKDGGLDRATLTIKVLIRKPGRSFVSAIQAAIRNQLEVQAFTTSGASMSQPVQVSQESVLMQDGLTYEGTQRFETLVQAA